MDKWITDKTVEPKDQQWWYVAVERHGIYFITLTSYNAEEQYWRDQCYSWYNTWDFGSEEIMAWMPAEIPELYSKRNMGKWIRVSEHRPESNTFVFVVNRDGLVVPARAYYDKYDDQTYFLDPEECSRVPIWHNGTDVVYQYIDFPNPFKDVFKDYRK